MLSFVASTSAPTSGSPAKMLGRGVLYLLIGLYFTLGVGYLALRWWVWPNLDRWRPDLVMRISERVGRPVEIGELRTGFAGLSPMVTLERVRVVDPADGVVFEAPRVEAVVALRSLLLGTPHLALLALEQPRLVVRRLTDGRLRVAGVDIDPGAPGDDTAARTFLNQRRIRIDDGRVDWIDDGDGGMIRVGGVQASIGHVGRRHRSTLRIAEAGPLGHGIEWAGEFYRDAGMPIDALEGWRGEGFIGGDALDLEGWARRLRQASPPAVARGDLRLWFKWERGRADHMLVKADLAELRWRAVGRSAPPLALRAQARIGVARGGGYDATISELAVRVGDQDGVSLAGPGSLWIDDTRRLRSGALSFARLNLAMLHMRAREWPLPASLAHRLERLVARGVITRAEVSFTLDDRLAYDADVAFEGLSLVQIGSMDLPRDELGRPLPGMPSVENVSGRAVFQQDRGRMQLEGRRVALTFPGVFERPRVPLDGLRAELSWMLARTPQDPAITVDVESMSFDSPDAAGHVSGRYRSGGKGPGIVEIDGRLRRAQAAQAWRYLPLQIPQPVRDWVRTSVRSGSLADGRFRLKGDLWDFPFRDPAQGEFEAQASLGQATLAYAPDWPEIEQIDGSLRFERTAMEVRMARGLSHGVRLSDTRARIDDLADAVLRIEGVGQGAAQDMVRFVNDSPVSVRIDDFTRATRVEGGARLGLNLELPLADLARTRVAGGVHFERNRIELDDTIPPFSDVTGTLAFSEAGLALREIEAGFLGGRIRVDGETGEDGRFALRAHGGIGADAIRAVTDNTLTRALTGATEYRALLDVRRRLVSLSIESDLVGLGSDLPPPFDKPAREAWPLRVHTEPGPADDPHGRASRDTLHVELRDAIRLAFERQRDPRTGRLMIQRGAFAVGAPPVIPERGFAVNVQTGALDIDRWWAVLSGETGRPSRSAAEGEFAEDFSIVPERISVVAEEVQVGGKDLHEVVLGASRLGGFWRASVHAREIDGYFTWREPAPGQRVGALAARFERLEIPPSRRGEVETLFESSPRDLPALDITAREFVLGERKLGSLSLQASNGGSLAHPVWNLNMLRIEHPAAVLSASGQWSAPAGGVARSTRLDFDLSLSDSGRLLDDFGVRDAVRGGAGVIAGGLSWKGSPLALDYASLDGTLRVDIGKGQFLKTEPGLAKLIGVLNLQSLPRRLSLDFTDVFSEGFVFDQLQGDVRVGDGIASTDALAMLGTQAAVRISGRANLHDETQALDVSVRPALNAGLASLAYAAMVNPALGLTTFLAQWVLRKPLEDIFTYQYRVTGSWADPQVSRQRRDTIPAPAVAP